jgi:hypothetical protein
MGSTLKGIMIDLCGSSISYLINMVYFFYIGYIVVFSLFALINGCASVVWKMSRESSIYAGFTDSASCHMQNVTYVAWVIYSSTNLLVSVGDVYLGETTNNIPEYSFIIKLL